MSDELDRMYEVATDGETSVLDDLRLRAGLIWRCESEARDYGNECGWFNAGSDERCERCGAQREVKT